jgi:hypothetical protein
MAISLPLFAQTGEVTTVRTGAASGSIHMSPRRFAGMTVTGAPYSAQRVSEHVQVGADGTRFTTNNQQETIYRDSQGRTRTERPSMMGPIMAGNAQPDSPLIIEISDPVANVGYTLDTQNKVAHRYTFEAQPGRAMTAVAGGGSGEGVRFGVISAVPAPPGAPVAAGVVTTSNARGAAGPNDRPRPEVQREDLGTRMIEGVMARGDRFTQTWAAGSQGNDRPFQTTSENWMSTDLKMSILSRSVDPRNGENTMKLINISLAEPSAALFMPPADYRIVDETGPFEIRWTRQ